MDKIIFLNIGWMSKYSGPGQITGGGKYVCHGGEVGGHVGGPVGPITPKVDGDEPGASPSKKFFSVCVFELVSTSLGNAANAANPPTPSGRRSEERPQVAGNGVGMWCDDVELDASRFHAPITGANQRPDLRLVAVGQPIQSPHGNIETPLLCKSPDRNPV